MKDIDFYAMLGRIGIDEVRCMLAENDLLFFNRRHDVERWLSAASAASLASAANRSAALEERREGRRTKWIIIGIITTSVTAIVIAIIEKFL